MRQGQDIRAFLWSYDHAQINGPDSMETLWPPERHFKTEDHMEPILYIILYLRLCPSTLIF